MPVRAKTDGSTLTLVKVGRRLRAIRELADITQEKLCELLGVDQSTYSKWERGKRVPDVLVLTAFAARFRTTLDFIFTGSPVGTHPQLASLLRLVHSDLVQESPSRTEQDTDKALASYRAAIVADPTN
jgi:transcriptional regulator with XRE-family HTH domain